MLNTLDIQLQEKYFTILGHTDQQVFAYKLRAIALDQKLSLHAFGRIIFQLAQRRGFLSNKKAITKKTNDKDDDEGKVKTGISDLDKAIKEGGFRTLGEYFASLDPEECRIRQRWTGRQMYRDELDLIWNTQAKYHKELNEKLMKEIEQAIFFQRPLKSQKSLIGHCALEKNKRNCPKADLHFQRFRYWQKIIDLKILRDGTNPEPLTSDEQDLLAKELDISGKLTFSKMRKILGFKKISAVKKNESETFWQVGRFNLEVDDDGEKELIGNKTAEKIYAILKEQWLQMSLDEQDTLVSVITQFASEKALAKRLVKKYHFTEYLAGELAKLQFEQGYSSISRQAIDKILPLMLEKRIPFKTAEKQIYGDIDHNNNIYDLLPPILTAVPSLKNPVVSRALTELRKVVNCIVREYGKPELIRIELARDMKKGRQEREKIFKDISEQEKKRKLAVKQLEENGIIAPNSRDILKFLLWQECDQKCPYTGKTITFQALFGESAQFDIEHIIPMSRSLDNSFANKTLCYNDENRHYKKNMTPFECYHNDPQRYEDIINRVKAFHGDRSSRRKLQLFQLKEITSDFSSRMLNDTRYISTLAGDYLGLFYGGQIDPDGKRRIQVCSGGTTAWLRNEWDLNSILNDGGNEKNRSDHRHHAVDAVVIALTSAGTVKKLAHAAELANELHTNRLFAKGEVSPPTENFLDLVREAVAKINVSYRVNKRVCGPLHEETNYSRSHLYREGKKIQKYRHVRKPINTITLNKIESIVDPVIRMLVKSQLEKIGGQCKNFNGDNLPMLCTKDGRMIPIKKARCRKNVTVMPVGKPNHERFVESGNNHHLEIIAILDENGMEVKWEGIVVSMFEAYRRQRCHEPIICRDHGPGKVFKFSLALKEYIIMKDSSGNDQLFIVRGISQDQKGAKQLSTKKHCDARPTKEILATKGLIHNINTLMEKGIKKVYIDPLGNISFAND